jgi:hypothetical protein
MASSSAMPPSSGPIPWPIFGSSLKRRMNRRSIPSFQVQSSLPSEDQLPREATAEASAGADQTKEALLWPVGLERTARYRAAQVFGQCKALADGKRTRLEPRIGQGGNVAGSDCWAGSQTFVEDCMVCCNPIAVRPECDPVTGELTHLSAVREND